MSIVLVTRPEPDQTGVEGAQSCPQCYALVLTDDVQRHREWHERI